MVANETALDAFKLRYEEDMPSAKRMDVLKLLARRHLQERKSARVLLGIAMLNLK